MRVLLGDRRLGPGGGHQPAIRHGCDASTAASPGRPMPVSTATTPGSNGREQHHDGHTRAPRPERATRPRLGASSRSRQQRDHAGYALS
jgi:hypothetical protein